MVPPRTVFFAVNTAACAVWICGLALWAADGSDGTIDPISVVIAAIVSGPALAILICEWLLFFRFAKSFERPLGVIAGIVGALVCFAFFANLAEAMRDPTPAGISFWLLLGVICFGIATYAFWCCWLRVRHKTLVDYRGFPVCVVESGAKIPAREGIRRL